jgi:hypothetical protein
VKGPWSQPNVESGASLLHSLPRMSHFLKSEHISSTDFFQVLAEACWSLVTRASHISKATLRYMRLPLYSNAHLNERTAGVRRPSVNEALHHQLHCRYRRKRRVLQVRACLSGAHDSK